MVVNENKNLNRPITTTTTHHAILILSLLFLSPTLPAVNSQQAPPVSPDLYPYAKFSPSMAIIIGVLVTALFFMGFFSIYFRRWSQSGSGGGSVRATLSLRSRRAAAARGLDASVIETFPTLAYSEVKDLKIGRGALECAVCLNEFEDDETLRLLPKCDHVFHPECIDLWLASHVTCPVCRADLVPKPGESADLPDGLSNPDSETSESNNNIIEVDTRGEFHVTIIPDEDQVLDSNNNLQDPPRSGIMKRNGSLRSNRPPRSGSVRSKLFGNKFSRSHSTGHSLVKLGETYDRFTLRLPAEVRKELIKKALLNPTGSCAAAGLACEQSARKGYRTGNGTGEGSSRGRSYRRLGSLERVVKSDRWVFSRMPSFLTRALSVSSPKVVVDGEASTSAKTGGNPLVKIDEAGLVANDSAKLPV